MIERLAYLILAEHPLLQNVGMIISKTQFKVQK